jgi:hypothetical protein
MQGPRYPCSAPHGVTLHEDVARREANRADNERKQAWRQRRWLWSAARGAVRARGKETPSKPESSRDGDEEEDEHEEEGEITPSPHSSPPEDLPSLGDLLSQQTGISISVRQTRCPRTGTGASSNLPPQSGLALVYFDL